MGARMAGRPTFPRLYSRAGRPFDKNQKLGIMAAIEYEKAETERSRRGATPREAGPETGSPAGEKPAEVRS